MNGRIKETIIKKRSKQANIATKQINKYNIKQKTETIHKINE